MGYCGDMIKNMIECHVGAAGYLYFVPGLAHDGVLRGAGACEGILLEFLRRRGLGVKVLGVQASRCLAFWRIQTWQCAGVPEHVQASV